MPGASGWPDRSSCMRHPGSDDASDASPVEKVDIAAARRNPRRVMPDPITAVLPVKKVMTELSSETRDKLKTVSTATLTTALFKRGLRNQFIQDVQPLNPRRGPMVGEAFTLALHPGARGPEPDRRCSTIRTHPQRKAVEECPPGRRARDRQPQGCARRVGRSILVARLMKRGVAGVVTDGGFRDSPEIAQLAIPAYHHRPSAPTNLTLHQALDINVPIGCGDAPVFPGDVDRRRRRRRGRDPGPSRRRARRRGRRDDGVRGLRHRGGAEGPLDPRPLSGDATSRPRPTSPPGAHGRRRPDERAGGCRPL